MTEIHPEKVCDLANRVDSGGVKKAPLGQSPGVVAGAAVSQFDAFGIPIR